jgi:hypothetical protein
VRSRWGTYGPRAIATSIALYATGHYAERHDDDGDVEQQGGMVLVDRDGTVLDRHAEQSLSDSSDPNDALAHVLSLAASKVGC